MQELWTHKVPPSPAQMMVCKQRHSRVPSEEDTQAPPPLPDVPSTSRLVAAADQMGRLLQNRHQGFLPNRRQHRMGGLAAIELAQAVQKLVRTLPDKRTARLTMHPRLNADSATVMGSVAGDLLCIEGTVDKIVSSGLWDNSQCQNLFLHAFPSHSCNQMLHFAVFIEHHSLSAPESYQHSEHNPCCDNSCIDCLSVSEMMPCPALSWMQNKAERRSWSQREPQAAWSRMSLAGGMPWILLSSGGRSQSPMIR